MVLVKQLKMKQKQKGRFLGMLLAKVGASVLGNVLAGKGVIQAGKGTIRTR